MIERNRMCRTVFSVLLICVGAFLAGCASGHPSAGTVQITSTNGALTAGASTQLQAIDTTLLSGTIDITNKASWTSSNPAVATVTPTGLLIGNTPGSAIITAAYSEASGSLAVVIANPLITGLAVAPANATVVAGASVQYTATGTYANHTTADVTSSATWTVAPASVATITSSGLLTAILSGSYVVTAVSGSQTVNHTATAAGTVTGALLSSIAITPAMASVAGGTTQQFTATATYNNKMTADISSSVTWTSSDTTLLTVSSTGLGTAHGNNPSSTVQLTATSGTVTATVPVTITPGAAMTQLVVQPTSSSIANGSAEKHTATAYFSDGTQLDVTNQVTWSSTEISAVSNAVPSGVHAQDTTPIIAFAPNGIDIATSPGTASLSASMGSLQTSSTVIVTPATISSLSIQATKTLIPAGATQQVQLIGVFSDGSTQDLSLTANWSSANPDVATITSTGLASAMNAGNVVFSARFGELTASSTGFQVLPTGLISLSLNVPHPANLVGLPQQLQVTGTYSDGSTHDMTGLSAFQSEDPSIYTVSATGLALELAQGTTQVTATVGGLTAVQTVAVFASAISSMQVLPVATKIPLGTQYPFTASIELSSGTPVDVTVPSVWTSADPSVLTVNSVGVVKTGKVGKTTISASVLGATGVSQTIEVTAAKLTKLIISKGTPVLTPTVIANGTGQPLIAVGYFSDGSQQVVTQDASWATANNTIATLDSTGVVRGVAPGQTTASASLLGMTATTQVTVTDATLVSTALSPGNAKLPVGIYRQYALTGTFSDGTTQDLTLDAVFQAPTPFIVGLSPQGIVSGDSVGIGQISAQYGYFSASTPVQVTAARLTGITLKPLSNSGINNLIRVGEAELYSAIGTFSDGSTQDLVDNVVFSSSNLDVARMLQSGLALATDVGMTQVSAVVRGITATTNLQVYSNVLTGITLGPANPSVVAGGSQQLSATGVYADGSSDDLTALVTWSSSNPAIVVVNSTGLATATASATTGSVLVTAAYNGVSASFTVTVGSGGGGGTPSATLTGITVTPTSSHIAKGTTKHLTATGIYSDGTNKDITTAVVWSSTQPATALVNDHGLVTAVAPGLVSIQASTGTFMSSSIVVVSAAALQSLSISPSGASFGVGATQQFMLTGTFTDGSMQDLTSSATWTSSNAAVASISSTGLATGISAGPVQFTGSYGGQSVTSSVDTVTGATLVSISVSPSSLSLAKGTSQQFTVTGTYSDGTTRDLTHSSTYTSSNPAVLGATSGGLITGTGAGMATITIVSGGVTFTTQPVSVTAATLVSIAITPMTPSLAAGTMQQFTATGTFSDGTMQNLSSQVVWTSSNPQVATIDSSGNATGDMAGSVQISATFNGVTGSTGTVQVTPAQLTALVLSPTSAQIAKGTTQQFTATGVFTDGTTQNLSSQVMWSSSNGAVVGVNASGLATGTGVGTAQLTATYMGKSASTSSFTVTPATLVSLSFMPAAPMLASGTSTMIEVIGTYSDGTTQDLTSSATFSSSNVLVATVSSSGNIMGGAPGTSTITVQAGGQTSSFNVAVSAAVLTSLTITPASPSPIPEGTTEQFNAIGTFSDGSMQNVSSSATWVSSNVTVATVTQTGLATGVGLGSTVISASFEGQTASTPSVTVTAPTVASITVSPQGASAVMGNTQQFTATANYTNSTSQDASTQVTWSSSNMMVASISPTGLAAAATAGSTVITAQLGALSGTSTFTVTATAPPKLLRIVVTPATGASVTTGATQQFTAMGVYSDGSMQNLSNQATWTSSSVTIATVNGSGLATGVAVGSVTIQAAFGGQSGTAPLSVTAPPVTLQSIAVTPATATIGSGSTQQYTATGTYSDGSTQSLTTQVTWSSSNNTDAVINAAGLATGVAPGSVTITGLLGSISGTASLVVTAPPPVLVSIAVTPATASINTNGTQQFTATGTYADGSTMNISSQVTWSSSSTTVATINGTGQATGVAGGSSTITATVGAMSGTATLTVTVANVTLLSITVAPSIASIAPAGTQQFAATGNYSDGSTQSLTTQVTWASSNTLTAMISAAGVATGLVPGNVTISATLGSVTGTASLTVTVTPVTLQSIAVTPASASIFTGATQQYTATGTYSDNSTQNLTTQVTWSSNGPSFATINSAGLATGVAPGGVTIQAVMNGTSGMAALTVSTPPVTLQSIAVTPASAMINKAATQQYTATGTYSDASTQNLTSQVTWSSSVPSVASINSGGLATGVAAGNTQISAAFSGQTGTAMLTVSPAALNSIAVTPAAATVAAGTSQQYKAVGTFADGSTEDLTTMVTWSSSNTTDATINANGFASTTATGTATITAQSGAVSGTATLTISTATATGLQVTPSSVSGLPVGDVQQLTSTATFSDGSSENVTSSVTYRSSDPTVAKVDANGVLTGVGPGSAVITATLGAQSAMVPVSISNATLTSITVTPANPTIPSGQSQQLTATGTYSDGSTEDLTNVAAWTSSDPAGISVSSTGNVMVMTPENVTITATYAGVAGTDAITGSAAVVTGISVSPASTTLAVGQTQQFAATATYSDGSQQTATASAHWSVSDATKASIANGSGAGLLTANAAGSLSAMATINGISGSASVTISAATLSSLTINPSLVNSLPAGTTKQLSVTATYSDGSNADVTNQVTWTTGQASTAFVDTNALLHAVTSGVTTIDAHLSGVDGTAVVTVGNATLTSIAITPSAPTRALGQTVQMTATGTYSDGSTSDLSSQVQWTSAVPAVATISGTGLVTTLTTGTSTLTATLNATTASTLLTVTSATLQSISVTSAQGSFALGQSLPLTATGFYSDGSTQNLTNSVTWTSSAPTVGVVSSTGVATGVTTGTFVARATSNGITGTESLIVTNAVLTSIAVTPQGQVIVGIQGVPVQFTATGTFSNGTTQNLTNSVHWTTSGVVIGSISQSGLFTTTGVGVGMVTATSGTISGSTQLTVVSIPLL